MKRKATKRAEDKNGLGHDLVASACREMRETADANERLGFHDLRNLSTDSLRAWADIVEETPKNVKVDEDTSDGYHTFGELYRYRMLYNAAFFNMLARHTDIPVVKSHRHGDGELCFGGGWFIVMAQLPTGQVSNHYEDRFWGLFDVPEVEKAPEWDGHTPNDAADRIEAFLKTRRTEKSESGGNASAMREALMKCNEFFRCDDDNRPLLCNLARKADEATQAALSAPARNCDVGTVEEQLERHRLYCIGLCTVHECGYNLEKHDTETCKKCFAKWAQMPFDSKGKCEDVQ